MIGSSRTLHTLFPQFDASSKLIALAGKSCLLKLATAALGALTISACATPASPYQLPTVSNSAEAATVQVKSAHNPSDVQFVHLLSVDGEVVMKLKESDTANFQLDPGARTFSITCHVVPDPDLSGLPINLSVIDGKAELETDLAAGDQICLKVSKAILTCARLEDSALTQCQ